MAEKEHQTEAEGYVAGIHGELESAAERLKRSQEPCYMSSRRNSQEDNTLRELLLSVRNDAKLAEFVKKASCPVLYDPNPDNEKEPFLVWGVSDEKIIFRYAESTYALGIGIISGGAKTTFELVNDKFYAKPKDREVHIELPDLFPDLTASKLEESIKKRIREDIQRKIEHEKRY